MILCTSDDAAHEAHYVKHVMKLILMKPALYVLQLAKRPNSKNNNVVNCL